MRYFCEESDYFCTSLKYLPKVTMKRFGFISLAEEISKHPTINLVMGSLVLMFIKIYNEREQAGEKSIFREWNGAKSFV